MKGETGIELPEQKSLWKDEDKGIIWEVMGFGWADHFLENGTPIRIRVVNLRRHMGYRIVRRIHETRWPANLIPYEKEEKPSG